jgi:hypothetical protein
MSKKERKLDSNPVREAYNLHIIEAVGGRTIPIPPKLPTSEAKPEGDKTKKKD